MKTADIAEPIAGEKLYQERARAALPLLVRQAHAGEKIYYSDLAQELGMPNPRNLNFVLGSIGQTLELLSKQWNEKIPPINALVVNKSGDLPGDGIGSFLVKKEDFSALPMRRKKEIVKAELQHIFLYPRWKEVLELLSLKPAPVDFSSRILAASQGFGGGEGELHKALKEYVAQHPQSIGLKENSPIGAIEYPLPSGDTLDVSFMGKNIWVAAEVKSAISSEADIVRGIFQCVKYIAVMEAVLTAQARSLDVKVMLVLESSLPQSLVALKNILGIEVVEYVTPKK